MYNVIDANNDSNKINSLYSSAASLNKANNSSIVELNNFFIENYGKNNAETTKSVAEAYQIKQFGIQISEALSELNVKFEETLSDDSIYPENQEEISAKSQNSEENAGYNLQSNGTEKKQTNPDNIKEIKASKTDISSNAHKVNAQVNNKPSAANDNITKTSALNDVQSAKNFVKVLNEALEYAKSNPGKGTEKISDDIWSMNDSYSEALSSAGINTNKDGSLSIDEDKLAETASDGSLAKLFQENSGFAKRAENIASNMENGSVYANKTSNQQSPKNNYQYNPYAALGISFELGS